MKTTSVFKTFSPPIILILLLFGVSLGGVQNASADWSQYHLEVHPQYDLVYALGWEKGTELTMEILDSSGQTLQQITIIVGEYPWNPDIAAGDFSQTGFDFQPGQTLKINGAGVEKVYLIPDPKVTEIDVNADIIRGTGTPGAQMLICANHPDQCEFRWATVDATGNWMVSFAPSTYPSDSTGAIDLQPGSNGWADEFDAEGDQTWADSWLVPNPIVTARLSENSIYTQGWPTGANLHLSIDSAAYQADQTASPCGWDPACSEATFELGPNFILEPGQEIAISDGILTKSLRVMDLYVESYDPAAKTVSGHSDPDAHVGVNYGGLYLDVQADGTGSWQVSFDPSSGPLHPSTGGEVSNQDEDGDATVFRFNIGNIFAYPESDGIELQNCILYRSYTLTIDDPSNGPGDDYTVTSQSELGGDGKQVVALFSLNGFDLDTGDQITIASGHDVRTLVVAPKGTVSFDTINDIISGTNQPNNYVASATQGAWREVKTGPSGEWSIDYKVPGPNGEPIEDIVPGTGTAIFEYDADADFTGYGFSAPILHLEVRPKNDRVLAFGWDKGVQLTMSITDSQGQLLAVLTTIVGGAPWDPNLPTGDFFHTGFDFQPGQVLTVSGNGATKTYLIPNPIATQFDVIADTVSGTGTPEPGAQVLVCANLSGKCTQRTAIIDETGNWTVSFAPSTNPSDSPNSFDLQPGSSGYVDELDADGDLTWGYDWVVPSPTSGSVLGIGWFNSPAGAYASNPEFAGKAAFTFAATYTKKSKTPIGSVQFAFRGFIFQSTSLDWLVVEGERMQLEGTGKINGKGTYGFIINAVDENRPGGEGRDAFRIRIWKKDTGQIIYDNMPGAADSTDPATTINGGSIIIH